jgi:hypothetical protein
VVPELKVPRPGVGELPHSPQNTGREGRGMSDADSDSWSDRDVFTGPAVERAMRIATRFAGGGW